MKILKVRGNRIKCASELIVLILEHSLPSVVTQESQMWEHAGSLPIIQYASSSRKQWHQMRVRVGERVSEV